MFSVWQRRWSNSIFNFSNGDGEDKAANEAAWLVEWWHNKEHRVWPV